MGGTLVFFLMYHASLVKEGATTNERIKRSEIKYAIEKELSIIQQKLDTYPLSQYEREEVEDQKKFWKKKLSHAKNIYGTGRFWKNLKEIFNA